MHTISTFLSAVCMSCSFEGNNTGIARLIGRSAAQRPPETCFRDLPLDLLTVSISTQCRHAIARLATLATLSLLTCAAGGTRLDLDERTGALHIQVDADAPSVIELQSEDLLPIRWERGRLREAFLPAIALRAVTDLAIVDDQSLAYALPIRSPLPQIMIDPGRYAPLAAWHGQPILRERRQIVLLGVLFSLGLLMTLLVRRRAMAWGTLYCAGWIIGLWVVASDRPGLIGKDLPGERFQRVYVAREAQTLRLGDADRAWIPIVESGAHLQTLNPRLVVRGNAAELLLDLPQGGKVILTQRDDSESTAR